MYFLIGIDAFRDIAKWYKAEELLRECEFIIAARPGYSLADVAESLPEGLRPKAKELNKYRKSDFQESLRLPGVTLHLLPETHEDVSATQIRAAMKNHKGADELVPDSVAEYIRKEGLYRVAAKTKPKAGRSRSKVKGPAQAKSA